MKKRTPKKHTPITQSRIDQLSNDISEEIASGTKAELREVVKYWMEKAQNASQQEHVKRLDEMLRLLRVEVGMPKTDPKEDIRKRREYEELVERAGKNTPPPPTIFFPQPTLVFPKWDSRPFEITC